MEGETYMVVDPFTGRAVLGPFDDKAYATKCMRRYEDNWPGALTIEESYSESETHV